MTEQHTPDELNIEQQNELICEKLLGWIRHNYPANDSPVWEVPSKAGEFQPTVFVTPSFTTWAEAGLILEALREKAVVTMHQLRDGVPQRCTIVVGFSVQDEGLRKGAGVTLPLAIRAAALEYIRSLP